MRTYSFVMNDGCTQTIVAACMRQVGGWFAFFDKDEPRITTAEPCALVSEHQVRSIVSSPAPAETSDAV